MDSARPEPININQHTRSVGIESGLFPVVDYGNGPVVVLLHGFPDSRHLWRYQVPALSDQGFRVVAPDLRGFGDAPKPESVRDYEVGNSRDDIVSILETLDVKEYRVVGHDWGSEVAWNLTKSRPDEVERLALLGVGRGKDRRIESWERSWYFWFFQFDDVAEAWLRHDNWRLFRNWMREEGDFDRYIQDLSRPGALTAALNWYRANVAPDYPDEANKTSQKVTCPVLGVWSDGDHHLTEKQMTGTEAKVDGPWRYEKITDASHWMMLDRPAELNDILVSFLAD